MAKDYAKRYKTQATRRKKPAPRPYLRSIFVFSIILIAIIAGGAGYYYHHHSVAQSNSTHLLPPVTEAQDVSLKKASLKKAPILEAKEEPVEYEFYTLLPKINVPDPVQNTTPPEQQPGYWLQMAVYYNMRDASAMVDRLQLLGLDPVITERKSTKSDKVLYVVIMGPYPTKEASIIRQQELKKINVTSYIFHVDPPIPTSTPTTLENNAVPSTSRVPVISATPVDLSA